MLLQSVAVVKQLSAEEEAILAGETADKEVKASLEEMEKKARLSFVGFQLTTAA